MKPETTHTRHEAFPAPDSLLLNGKRFYYDEIAVYSFRNSIPINGYEAKTLEFCKNWLNGQQEFPIQTSGSTGIPKQITLTRQQLEASARRTLGLLGLRRNDRAYICLNTEYIAGMMMLVRGFIGELDMTITEPSGNPLAAVPAGAAFEFQSYVPFQLQSILEETPEKIAVLDSARAILVGGGPVSQQLEKLLQQVKAPVYHTYAMTETVSHVALRCINGAKKSDAYTAPEDIYLGLDARGCLTISADVTNHETIVTNDLVRLHTPHSFEWLGRIDNVINSGGVKVQAEKVETALALALHQLGIHRQFFIAPLPDEKLGQRVIAVLEGAPLGEADETNIRQIMGSQLSKYEVPKEVCYLPGFKLTSTGKIDRPGNMLLLQ